MYLEWFCLNFESSNSSFLKKIFIQLCLMFRAKDDSEAAHHAQTEKLQEELRSAMDDKVCTSVWQ